MIAALRNMIKRIRTTSNAKQKGAFQYAQVSYMGRSMESQIFHDYGFFSAPPAGGIGIALNPRAEDGDLMSFVCHPKYNAKDLKPGETIVGNFVVKATLFFDEKGRGVLTLPDDLVITCKNLNATVSGDTNVSAKGSVTVKAGGNGTLEAAAWTIKGPVSMTDAVSAQSGLSVSGSMTNNGKDVGDGHGHLPGTFKDGDGRDVTGESGEVS